MTESVFVLYPNNPKSIYCVGTASSILNVFIEENSKSPNPDTFPILEATFNFLQRLGTDRLNEMAPYIEDDKFIEPFDGHIRGEIKKLVRNTSDVPSMSEIMKSWNLPFGYGGSCSHKGTYTGNMTSMENIEDVLRALLNS